MDDTGQNCPENRVTLILQQLQLLRGKRVAQMFPVGTKELPVPPGFDRVETKRGVFHFDPARATPGYITWVSDQRLENLILGLGPYNKKDVMDRVNQGEELLAISEVSPAGIEVKSAIAAPSTLKGQISVFENTKLADSKIKIEPILDVLSRRKATNGSNP